MQRAAELDAELAALRANGSASLPSLFCVPLLVKDNIDAVGTPTTAGEWASSHSGGQAGRACLLGVPKCLTQLQPVAYIQHHACLPAQLQEVYRFWTTCPWGTLKY
jgi:hypothetical protein